VFDQNGSYLGLEKRHGLIAVAITGDGTGYQE